METRARRGFTVGRGRGLEGNEHNLTGITRLKAVASPGGMGRAVYTYSPAFLRAVREQMHEKHGYLDPPDGVVTADAPLKQNEHMLSASTTSEQNKANAGNKGAHPNFLHSDRSRHQPDTASATRTVPARAKAQQAHAHRSNSITSGFPDSPNRSTSNQQASAQDAWRRSSSSSTATAAVSNGASSASPSTTIATATSQSAPHPSPPQWQQQQRAATNKRTEASARTSTATDFASAASASPPANDDSSPLPGGFPPPPSATGQDGDASHTDASPDTYSTYAASENAAKSATQSAVPEPRQESFSVTMQNEHEHDSHPGNVDGQRGAIQQGQQQADSHIKQTSGLQGHHKQQQSGHQGRPCAELLKHLGVLPQQNEDSNSTSTSKYPAAEERSSNLWEYKDPKGVVRGPFPSGTIVDWYDEGFFPRELPIRRHRPNAAGESEGFQNLYMLLPTLRKQAQDEMRQQEAVQQVSAVANDGQLSGRHYSPNDIFVQYGVPTHGLHNGSTLEGTDTTSGTQHASEKTSQTVHQQAEGTFFQHLGGPEALFGPLGQAQSQGMYQQQAASSQIATCQQYDVKRNAHSQAEQAAQNQRSGFQPIFSGWNASQPVAGMIPLQADVANAQQAPATYSTRPHHQQQMPQDYSHQLPTAPAMASLEAKAGRHETASQPQRVVHPDNAELSNVANVPPAAMTQKGGFGSQAAPVQVQMATQRQQLPQQKQQQYHGQPQQTQATQLNSLQAFFNDPRVHQTPHQLQQSHATRPDAAQHGVNSEDEMTPFNRVMMHLQGSKAKQAQHDTGRYASMPQMVLQQQQPVQAQERTAQMMESGASPLQHAQVYQNQQQGNINPGTLQQAFVAQQAQHQYQPRQPEHQQRQQFEQNQRHPQAQVQQQSPPSAAWSRPVSKQQPNVAQQPQSTQRGAPKSLVQIQQEEEEAQRQQQAKNAAIGMPTPDRAPGSWAAAAGRMQGHVNSTSPQHQNSPNNALSQQTQQQQHQNQQRQMTQQQSPQQTMSSLQQQALQEHASEGLQNDVGMNDGARRTKSNFWAWCEDRFEELLGTRDTTLAEYLLQLASAAEVQDYVSLYLGNSQEAQEFANEFLKWVRSDPSLTGSSGSSNRRRRKKK